MPSRSALLERMPLLDHAKCRNMMENGEMANTTEEDDLLNTNMVERTNAMNLQNNQQTEVGLTIWSSGQYCVWEKTFFVSCFTDVLVENSGQCVRKYERN